MSIPPADDGRATSGGHVACRRCRCRLSDRVDRAAPSLLDREATGGVPTIGAGLVCRDPEPVVVWVSGPRDRTESPREEVPAGSLVVHPASTRCLCSSGRDTGCCGSDGCDGPNRSCDHCHAVVGMMRTDCWTRYEIRFLASAVDLVGLTHG
ncbi:hypothetical protein V3N99_18780 [Dermatophilaceae bacterium Soc4.6]